MKELRDWLTEGDPVAHEPPLSGADAQRMRRAIVAAADSRQVSLEDWARGSWAAVTVVIALTVAVSMSGWLHPVGQSRRVNAAPVAPTAAPVEPGARRQVQMIAPRGTRVIWIFNDDFKP
jgi:hypothetical protein